jgi:hypothetical protein
VLNIRCVSFSSTTFSFFETVFTYFAGRIFSEGSSVGIATGYGLDGRGVGVRVPVGSRIFVVQTGSGAQPASYPIGTGCSFSRGKAAGA